MYNSLIKEDLYKNSTKEFRNEMEFLSDNGFIFSENTAVIAGSSVMRSFAKLPLYSSDIDIFCFSSNTIEHFSSIIDKKFSIIYSTAVADTFIFEKNKKINYQLVKKPYNSIMDLLNNFDFNMVRFAATKSNIFYTENSITDLKNKKIVLNENGEKVGNNIGERILKYYNRGYSLDLDEALHILERIEKNGTHSFY